MKIYTKTGDKGETGIIGGRVPKSSQIIDAIGCLDELNAIIGIVISIGNDDPDLANLKEIQTDIFNIGALVAGGTIKLDLQERITDIEISIDEIEKDLNPLQNFIMPGGDILSANIHLARSICRRAERTMTEFMKVYNDIIKNEDHKMRLSKEADTVRSYLNRLSDYLFVLARYINKQSGIEDVLWLPGK
jgi:cob(I)alamin adenosyltransferase